MKFVFCIVGFVLLTTARAATIVAGPGQAVTTLRAALAKARSGDTILLRPGLYREGALTITRPLTLIGEDYPVLDGENKYEILLISGKNITIRGIRFRASGYSALNDYASVKLVDATDVWLDRNIVEQAYFGIHLSNCTRVRISGNRVTGLPTTEQMTGNGIHLWKCSQATIENNVVKGHRDGIYFEFVSQSQIRRNHSEGNIRYGLHFMFSNDDTYDNNTFRDNGAGVAVMYSKRVHMTGNLFEQNWGPSAYGILLKDITDGSIRNNRFVKNTVGIFLEGSSRMEISRNQFRENGWALRVQASCDNNRFLENNFQRNSFDVGTNGTLVLNEFRANYWDKYEGYDLNRDGTGDLAFHPVSMYSMIVEQNPNALILLRSFTVQLLDKAEKAIPSLTPEALSDPRPRMKSWPL